MKVHLQVGDDEVTFPVLTPESLQDEIKKICKMHKSTLGGPRQDYRSAIKVIGEYINNCNSNDLKAVLNFASWCEGMLSDLPKEPHFKATQMTVEACKELMRWGNDKESFLNKGQTMSKYQGNAVDVPEKKSDVEQDLPYAIGVKVVQYKKMTAHTFQSRVKNQNPTGENAPGYYVRYKDGYESWSPEGTFDEAYRPFIPRDDKPEMSVSQEHIDRLVDKSPKKIEKIGDKTTLVTLTLPCGFEFHETSSCVKAENYDHELGKKICIERIKNKLWELEGYLLSNSDVR